MPDVLVWNRCDNRCLMCTRPESLFHSSKTRYSLRALAARLARYAKGDRSAFKRRRGDAGYFLLTGGEPALHPDFISVVRLFLAARAPGGVCVLTNGRAFEDERLARSFCALAGKGGLKVAVSICGHDAASHDAVAGCPGAFDGAVAGIKNLLRFGRGKLEIELRHVLHGVTVGNLSKTLAMLEKEFGQDGYSLTLLFHKTTGRGASVGARRALDCGLRETAKTVVGNMKRLSRFDFRLYHFPLCVLPEKLRDRAQATLAPSDAVFPAAKCRACRARGVFCGLLKEYYQEKGCCELETL